MPLFRKRVASGLDRPLLPWGPKDSLSIADMLTSALILGGIGSGKTSGSGRTMARALLAHPGSGGLIICAKPEDEAMWKDLFARAGRSRDLLVFGPHSGLRCNLLDCGRKMGWSARDIATCMMTVAETLRGGETKSGEEKAWKNQGQRQIENAVVVLTLATGKVSGPDIQHFLSTALQSPKQLNDPAWEQGFHGRCFRAAHQAPKTAIQQNDYQLATDYFFREWPTTADRTRSGVTFTVNQLLHQFNSGVVRELLSTTTNFTPDVVRQRKWILNAMPICEWGEAGSFTSGALKYLTQKRILLDNAPPETFSAIWCDEAQQQITTSDSPFLGQARSHGGCMVYLSQSIHSFLETLPGDAGKHQVNSLLSNFGIKILHALGDHESAKWASDLVGRGLQLRFGGSVQPDDDVFDALVGRTKCSSSFNEHWEPIIEPNVFMNGLRTGGQANNYLVDGIVVKRGNPFSDGQNWKWVTFSQRG